MSTYSYYYNTQGDVVIVIIGKPHARALDEATWVLDRIAQAAGRARRTLVCSSSYSLKGELVWEFTERGF